MNSRDTDILRRLLANDLSPQETENISTRLETEPRLLNLLEELSSPTSTETKILAAAKTSPPPPPEIRELVQELKSLNSSPQLDATSHKWQNLLQPKQPHDPPEALGRIGDLPIFQHLATGGMAHIFKALDPKLKRTVALKILSPILANDPETRTRFLREARAAAQLEHENVLPIYQVIEDELPFFTMRFLSGQSLQEALDQQRTFTLQELRSIALKVSRALHAAHQQGIIHRDIKPANILFSESLDTLVVCDFGIATTIEDPALTNPGSLIGTPHYMSPEQASGDPLDGRSDLFSLGAVLYHCATGHPPFEAKTTTAVIHQVLSKTPSTLDNTRTDLPDWFANLIFKLLSKKPDDRFPDAAKLIELLETKTDPTIPTPKKSKPFPLSKSPLAPTILVILIGSLLLFLLPKKTSHNPTEPTRNLQRTTTVNLLRSARHAVSNNQHHEALQLLQQATQLSPENSEARTYRNLLLTTRNPAFETSKLSNDSGWIAFERHGNTLIALSRSAELTAWPQDSPPQNIATLGAYQQDHFKNITIFDHLWSLGEGGNARGLPGNIHQNLMAALFIESHCNTNQTFPRLSIMARDQDVIIFVDSAGAIGVQQPDGKYLFVSTPGTPVAHLCLSANGTLACALLENNEALTFSPQNLTVFQRWKLPSPTQSITLLDNEELLLTSSKTGTIHFWNPKTGTPTHPPIPTNDTGLQILALPRRSEYLTRSDNDPAIRHWQIGNPNPLGPGLPHQESPLWFTCSPDGNLIYSLDQKRNNPSQATLRFWSLSESSEIIPPLEFEHPLACATIGADGTRLAVALDNGIAKRWTLPNLTKNQAH
ncbi:MAG: WD40 repeat domain-containing serine/threonine protein kinase [Verrucomicrobiota bacterium]